MEPKIRARKNPWANPDNMIYPRMYDNTIIMIAKIDKLITYVEISLPGGRHGSNKYWYDTSHNCKPPSKISGYVSLARVVRLPTNRLSLGNSFCKGKQLHFSRRILTYYQASLEQTRDVPVAGEARATRMILCYPVSS